MRQKTIPLVVTNNRFLFELQETIPKYLFFPYIDYEVKRCLLWLLLLSFAMLGLSETTYLGLKYIVQKKG